MHLESGKRGRGVLVEGRTPPIGRVVVASGDWRFRAGADMMGEPVGPARASFQGGRSRRVLALGVIVLFADRRRS